VTTNTVMVIPPIFYNFLRFFKLMKQPSI